MKKSIFLVCALLVLACNLMYATEICEYHFSVDFSYSMAVKSGVGSSGPGVESFVSVTPQADKMCIALPVFFFTDDKTIPSFEVPNVNYVVHDSGEIDFACKNQHINVSDESGNPKEITIYDIKGSIIEGKLDMTVNFKYGKMPFKLTVHYISK